MTHWENLPGVDVVSAARDGDRRAREQLVAEYLPLVYNIVGRALDGHTDVDDVVQETMFRVLDGLGGLREPSLLRSWVVAIAMNQIRHRWHSRRGAPVTLERVPETADPAGDFVDVTILRLGLSGQRREVTEATRWLDESAREVLALWWQEAAGELTRAELAAALDVPEPHAAVRVQRMKGQLEVSRVAVRALRAVPRCDELGATISTWDGVPSSVWRKRIARHARTCHGCSDHWRDLVPPQGLLAGMAMVVPLNGYPAIPPEWFGPHGSAGQVGPDDHAAAMPGTHDPGAAAEADVRPGSGHEADASAGSSGGGWPAAKAAGAGAGVAAGALLLALLWPGPEPPPDRSTAPPTPSSTASVAVSPSRLVPSPSSSPTPTRPAEPSPRRSTAPVVSAEQRLTELVNVRRSRAGCAPLRIDPKLSEAARGHADDMVAHGYFDHENRAGEQADSRISAAGYDWSMWGENLDKGTSDPSVVVDDWMDGSIHQENMLDCRYRDTGVGTAKGPGGTVWVQTLARPA